MKISTKGTVKTLKGDAFKQDDTDLTVGKAIATIVSVPRDKGTYHFDHLKLYILAQKFYQQTSVEIDEADLEKLKKTIETDQQFPPIILGQLVQVLNEAEKDIVEEEEVSAKKSKK
jgi:hypothetical protein